MLGTCTDVDFEMQCKMITAYKKSFCTFIFLAETNVSDLVKVKFVQILLVKIIPGIYIMYIMIR